MSAASAQTGQATGNDLERHGCLTRDAEGTYLNRKPGEHPDLENLHAHAVIYRIAVGPHQGQKAFTLQILPDTTSDDSAKVASFAGFSLHAGTAAAAHQRSRLGAHGL